MLDVRRLRILREVAARGTIAAAARSLAYTPSAVSQQLSALEREAGVALLDRGGGRIALSEAGRGLVRRTEGILDELEAEASRPALRMGEVDVAIIHENARHAPATEPRLQRTELFEEPLLLALPATDDPSAVSLAALAEERWISMPSGSACHALLMDACAQVGFTPAIAYHTNDFGVISTFVASGLGVALVPTLARPSFGPGVALRAVPDAHVARRLYAAVRAGTAQRPAVAAVLAALT